MIKQYTPPPRQSSIQDDDVPDYFFGRLIWTEPGTGMEYVVYDGADKHRFASRAAAEKWCIEQATSVNEEAAETLMRAAAHVMKASRIIEAACRRYPLQDKLTLDLTAVQLLRIYDGIDAVVSKYIPKPK